MNKSAPNEAAFRQALDRASAREAAELEAAAADNGPEPSCDIGEMLRRQAWNHLCKVLSGA